MIEFAYDEERAHNAILWFLKRHGQLDRLKLIKLVALADLMHLTKYGRPIAGGRYFAMQHGLVGSELYDELKIGMAGTTNVSDRFVRAVSEPDEEYLSETDLEVLEAIETKYGAWDAFRLADETHVPAWRKNWRGDAGGRKSYQVPYEDLLQGLADENVVALVEDAQDAERVLG
jgi:uncharacterized phage-associated protein